MTDDKTRVKDLSTELGVSTKDLLHTLRDLDIPAKSVMTMLNADEVARVRERHQGQTAEAGVDRKVVQPGVIVRRRRRDGEEGDAPVRRHADERGAAPSAPSAPSAPVVERALPAAEAPVAPAATETERAAADAQQSSSPSSAAAPAADAAAKPAAVAPATPALHATQPAPLPPGTTAISALRIHGSRSIELVAEGEAELQRDDTVLTADKVTYREPTDEVVAEGNVVLSRGTDTIRGPQATLVVGDQTGRFESPQYQLSRARGPVLAGDAHRSVSGSGEADVLNLEGENQYRLKNAM